jgi:hypothetical protein
MDLLRRPCCRLSNEEVQEMLNAVQAKTTVPETIRTYMLKTTNENLLIQFMDVSAVARFGKFVEQSTTVGQTLDAAKYRDYLKNLSEQIYQFCSSRNLVYPQPKPQAKQPAKQTEKKVWRAKTGPIKQGQTKAKHGNNNSN